MLFRLNFLFLFSWLLEDIIFFPDLISEFVRCRDMNRVGKNRIKYSMGNKNAYIFVYFFFCIASNGQILAFECQCFSKWYGVLYVDLIWLKISMKLNSMLYRDPSLSILIYDISR